ncbi:MAG: cytochrome c nitrite reductase small subunit [Anaerohalosphaeraceae bacterium]
MISTLLRIIKTLADIVLSLCGLGRGWQVFFYVLIGIAAGTGVVLVRIANATSYLSDSPQTCMNCHVMTDAYASWQRGSHGHAAVCTDCHVPHENMAAKWAFKGLDGTKHSAVFTFRAEPQTLELSATAVPVVQRNCLRCHGDQVQMVRLAGVSERKCWDCHQNIHGEVRSLSSSPSMLRPDLPNAGVNWLNQEVFNDK